MSTYEEVDEAIEAIKSEGNENIILLHCVSSYPTEFKDANLKVISTLKKRYPTLNIGYSDHTQGIAASVASVEIDVAEPVSSSSTGSPT